MKFQVLDPLGGSLVENKDSGSELFKYFWYSIVVHFLSCSWNILQTSLSLRASSFQLIFLIPSPPMLWVYRGFPI